MRRLDLLLVEQGLAESREKALASIYLWMGLGNCTEGFVRDERAYIGKTVVFLLL